MPPCKAVVVQRAPCFVYLRTPDGKGFYIGSPGSKADVGRFLDGQGIIDYDGAASRLEKWVSDTADLRQDIAALHVISNRILEHNVKSVVMTERLIGCPLEEGGLPGRTLLSPPKCLFENSKLGSTGDPPVPSGDPPDGTRKASKANPARSTGTTVPGTCPNRCGLPAHDQNIEQ